MLLGPGVVPSPFCRSGNKPGNRRLWLARPGKVAAGQAGLVVASGSSGRALFGPRGVEKGESELGLSRGPVFPSSLGLTAL